MVVFQIVNGNIHWKTEFHSINETIGRYPPDCLFVEAPDYVREGWGFDETKTGDARFTEPTPPEGWAYDRDTGTFYNLSEVPMRLEQSKDIKQGENKRALNEYLAKHPMTYTDGKKYGVTFEDQQEIALNLTQYQISVAAGVTNARLEWHASKEPCRSWTQAELTALTVAISNFVYPLFSKMQQFKADIYAAVDIAAVEAIKIAYEDPAPVEPVPPVTPPVTPTVP